MKPYCLLAFALAEPSSLLTKALQMVKDQNNYYTYRLVHMLTTIQHKLENGHVLISLHIDSLHKIYAEMYTAM